MSFNSTALQLFIYHFLQAETKQFCFFIIRLHDIHKGWTIRTF